MQIGKSNTYSIWGIYTLPKLDVSSRSDFEHEARILTSLSDPNLVGVLGVCFTSGDPLCMVCEYSDEGDLYHFLQDHVAETSLSKSSPGVATLR